MNDRKPVPVPEKKPFKSIWLRYALGRTVEVTTSTGDVIRGKLVDESQFELVVETLQGVAILHKNCPAVRVK